MHDRVAELGTSGAEAESEPDTQRVEMLNRAINASTPPNRLALEVIKAGGDIANSEGEDRKRATELNDPDGAVTLALRASFHSGENADPSRLSGMTLPELPVVIINDSEIPVDRIEIRSTAAVDGEGRVGEAATMLWINPGSDRAGSKELVINIAADGKMSWGNPSGDRADYAPIDTDRSSVESFLTALQGEVVEAQVAYEGLSALAKDETIQL